MKIVWDFGAVLFRWRPRELIARVLPQRMVDADSAAFWVAQIFQNYGGDWREFDRGTVQEPELAQRIARRTGLSVDEVHAVILAIPGELEAMQDSVTLLAALRERGHALYFLSNMPEPFAQHLERANAFVAWFIDGVFSCRVQLTKPEPAMFALAEQRFGLDPARTLFIDDHLDNILAADARGWQTVHARSPGHIARGLRSHALID